jgi:hypothetical protein
LKPLNFTRTVFIDRSFGGHRLLTLLSKTGFDVHGHKEFFVDDEDDHIWIPDIAARGWIIFTSDERISRDPINVKAVLESKAQVIITSDNNRLPEVWGAAFTVGRLRLDELLDVNPGPVYIKLTSATGGHVHQTKRHITHPLASIPSDPPALETTNSANAFFADFIKLR